jgi:hypothetical protein
MALYFRLVGGVAAGNGVFCWQVAPSLGDLHLRLEFSGS